ncbi:MULTISPECIES: WD40 repeat domain-containing protein [Fischerella]|uniref:WD40 repeat domain-containing protein n=1 Tax=Fischerella TaxID=1190 RepID=UPI000AF6FF06|nr:MULTISPECIES: hypothetical protein [Fischerella]
MWDLETGQIICQFTGKSYGVNSISFSPDGQILASGSADGTIRIWLFEYQVERGEKPKL